MDTDRRRDLGKGDCVRAEPPGGQGVRPGPGAHHQRLGRRLRRDEVSSTEITDMYFDLRTTIKVRLTLAHVTLEIALFVCYPCKAMCII